MKKVLYLGWIGFNNLGDEWMQAMFEQLAKLHLSPEEYQIIPSVPGVDIKDMTKYDTIVMGGPCSYQAISIYCMTLYGNKSVLSFGAAAMIACTRSASVPVLLQRAKSCA
ncbi:hypothetical protein ABEX25_06545 [Paenibacillus thiaminolyticus]|uniref:hypothetical protein n=1 Tax=Paenibacillus thiaminolyticus TaxID=49283 RepID=UPI003D2E6B66